VGRPYDVLAPRVRLDYTSLTATQHLVGNHLLTIDGDQATCTAAFQATHVLANPHG
jgi:SnoaL-like domain